MNILKYIAVVVLGVFAYSIMRNLYSTQSTIVEGLENKSNTSTSKKINSVKTTLDGLLQEMDEKILMDKYKKDYEDILLLQDEFVNKTLLELLTQNALSNNKDNAIISNINEIYNIKSAINSTMEYLDSQ